MDYPITIPGFEKQQLVWRTGAWKNALVLNGEAVALSDKKKREYSLTGDDGQARTVTLKYSFADPVPTVLHNGESYQIVPPVTTAQKVFAAVLHVPLFTGGAIGGGCGAAGFMMSLSFFRSKSSPFVQYLMVFGSAVLAWLAYFGLAAGFSMLIGA